MKRPELVKKLMNEGLSEKLLSNLTDKQLKDLSERVLSEATYEVSADKVDSIKGKVGDKDVIKVSEEDELEVSEEDTQEGEVDEVNEWVEGLVKSNYHPEVTTKKEMYEMIGALSDSADALGDANRMFSVDEQSPQPSEPDTDAPVREKPTTKPGKPKRENPFEPKHKPKPKAVLPKQLSFASLGIELKQAAE
jgi:hypothetical protein